MTYYYYNESTSFPGSLFSAFLGRWKKDPGCGWSRSYPESGWQKNLLGGRGGRVFCLVDVTDFVDFKSSSSRSKLLALSVFEVKFADEECYTISAVFRIEDFRSQRNSAAEWSINFLTVSKCKRSPTGSKWNQCISVSWVFEFGGNLFSSLCDFLNVKSISVVRSISRVFWLTFDLPQCELIYSFVLLTYKPRTYVSSASGLYKVIFRQMWTQGSLS